MIDISHSDQVIMYYIFLILILVVFNILYISLYHRFSASMALIRSVSVNDKRLLWFPVIFQVKIANSKSLKPITDDRNSCSAILVNSTNLVCNIIYTIIFFKAIKHNMSQMLSLAIHNER